MGFVSSKHLLLQVYIENMANLKFLIFLRNEKVLGFFKGRLFLSPN